MKKLVAVIVMVLGAAAFAQNSGSTAKGGTDGGQAGMTEGNKGQQAMGGWMPSKVTHEDKKGLDAMWKAWGEAFMNRDMDKVADMVDFPVLMVTDDGKGNVVTAQWDRNTWLENMKKSMQAMPEHKGKKMPMPKMRHDFLTNDIAVTLTTVTMPMGKQSMTVKSSSLVVHKDGKWLVKSMAEGGWGNMMNAQTPSK